MGGLYFSNNSYATPKLDLVLSRDAKQKKVVNELARRRAISKAEKGKKRKRKSKNKGKHRKGKKGLKEITIDNQPTQQVKGYNIVNVISAKRGPYKKQQSIGPPGSTGKKGSFGKSGAVRGGLMASQSDNIQFRDPAFGGNDPRSRAELKSLRDSVDRIEQRINGMGNNPAQQNQAGPLNGGNNAGNMPGMGAGGGSAQPPAPPLQPFKAPAPPPGGFKFGAPSSRRSSISSVKTSSSIRALANELGVSKEVVSNMTDDEFLRLLSQAQKKPQSQRPTTSSARSSSPKPRRPPAPPKESKEDLYRDWALADKLRAQKGTSISLSLRTSQGSPRSSREEKATGSFLARQRASTAKGVSKPPSEPVSSVAPPQYIAPRDVGQLAGQSPRSVASSGFKTLSGTKSSGLDSRIAEGQKRYGSFNPPPKPPKPFVARGKKKSPEYYKLFSDRRNISLRLKGLIPDGFFRKGSDDLSSKQFGKIRAWAKENLNDGGAQFISEQLDEWNVILTNERDVDKADKKKSARAQLTSGSGPEVLTKSAYVIPEAPFPTDPNVGSPSAEGVGGMIGNIAAGSAQLGYNVAGGVVGGGASLLSGIAGGVSSQLPSVSDVGYGIGKAGAVGAGALVRGIGGAIAGGYDLSQLEPSAESDTDETI